MIHTILELRRPFIVFDLETTGVKTDECRIVEIGFQLYTSMGLQKEWRSLINPGIPIPEEVQKIHGYSDTDVAEAPKFIDLAANIAHGFSDCDFGGKNVRFDLSVLYHEMKRSKVEWSYAGACVIDAERLEQIGEPRRLADLYKKHTGKDLVDAHSALADVSATSEVIYEQLRKYQILPKSIELLHRAQWPGWIDTTGLFRFKDGVPTVMFGKYRDQPMTKVPSGYWNFIITNDFTAEIKAIAEDAKRGTYPKA